MVFTRLFQVIIPSSPRSFTQECMNIKTTLGKEEAKNRLTLMNPHVKMDYSNEFISEVLD